MLMNFIAKECVETENGQKIKNSRSDCHIAKHVTMNAMLVKEPSLTEDYSKN